MVLYFIHVMDLIYDEDGVQIPVHVNGACTKLDSFYDGFMEHDVKSGCHIHLLVKKGHFTFYICFL